MGVETCRHRFRSSEIEVEPTFTNAFRRGLSQLGHCLSCATRNRKCGAGASWALPSNSVCNVLYLKLADTGFAVQRSKLRGASSDEHELTVPSHPLLVFSFSACVCPRCGEERKGRMQEAR